MIKAPAQHHASAHTHTRTHHHTSSSNSASSSSASSSMNMRRRLGARLVEGGPPSARAEPRRGAVLVMSPSGLERALCSP
ncbi:hypothetical protein [Pleurochrysis sp. endemic virus 2]|nr:hypothetical protein [Pleurochrysis sp. endemic virus 2]